MENELKKPKDRTGYSYFVKHDGMGLVNVPRRERTHELCKMAVTQNTDAIELVPFSRGERINLLIEVLTSFPANIAAVSAITMTRYLRDDAPDIRRAWEEHHGVVLTEWCETASNDAPAVQGWYEQALRLNLEQNGATAEEIEEKIAALAQANQLVAPPLKPSQHLISLEDYREIKQKSNDLIDLGTMDSCLEAFSKKHLAIDELPEHIDRKEFLEKLMKQSPNMILNRPSSKITLDFIEYLPDHIAIRLLTRRPFIKKIGKEVRTDASYLTLLTPKSAEYLVRLQPVNYIGLPHKYQTWELAKIVFGDWFKPYIAIIESDAFWSGFIESDRLRAHFIHEIPEKYRAKAGLLLDKHTDVIRAKLPDKERDSEPSRAIFEIHVDPLKIRFIANPSDEIIEAAIVGDYEAAKFIRAPRIAGRHLQLYAVERLHATRTYKETVSEEDLIELYRDQLEDEHAVLYSYWKIDNPGEESED